VVVEVVNMLLVELDLQLEVLVVLVAVLQHPIIHKRQFLLFLELVVEVQEVLWEFLKLHQMELLEL